MIIKLIDGQYVFANRRFPYDLQVRYCKGFNAKIIDPLTSAPLKQTERGPLRSNTATNIMRACQGLAQPRLAKRLCLLVKPIHVQRIFGERRHDVESFENKSQ